MLKSLKNLFNAPYNRTHKFFALYRFIFWKIIRLLKLQDIKFRVWHNCKIYLNYDSFQSMWVMYNYIVDWEEFNFISRAVKQNDVVFDIGTNMGFYTIWLSKFLNTNGRIHCFEPDQKNFLRLKANVEINHISSICDLNNNAVGDSDGEVFFTEKLDGENHILLSDHKSGLQKSVIKLDQYVADKNISNIRYCKIDVEGFEYMVLNGAINLLNSKNIDIIQLEINNTISNSGISSISLVNFLNEKEYILCSYDVDSSILQRINYTINRENYFAVHDLLKINKELRKFSIIS